MNARYVIAKAAMDGSSLAARQLLRDAGLLGCNPNQAYRWARSLVIRLEQWKDGRWVFLIAGAVVAGPTRTITGAVVNVDPPIQAWTGCKALPSFTDRAMALQWAESNGLGLS